jgi:molybdopterin converting factor small subunit
MMRVNIKSNFIVPGLESQEGIDLERSTITLRELLDELSERGPNRVEYVRSGARTINPDEWEISINDIPYHQWRDGLETSLKDGDTVTIIIVPLGGG